MSAEIRFDSIHFSADNIKELIKNASAVDSTYLSIDYKNIDDMITGIENHIGAIHHYGNIVPVAYHVYYSESSGGYDSTTVLQRHTLLQVDAEDAQINAAFEAPIAINVDANSSKSNATCIVDIGWYIVDTIESAVLDYRKLQDDSLQDIELCLEFIRSHCNQSSPTEAEE